MMEMLDISIPNSNPELGRRESVSLPPSFFKEDDMVVVPKRRGQTVNKAVARADGFYLLGKGKFKVTKGFPLPRKYDSIHYYGENGVAVVESVGGADAFARDLAADEAAAEESEETAAEESEETAAEETNETPEKPRRGRPAKTKASE